MSSQIFEYFLYTYSQRGVAMASVWSLYESWTILASLVCELALKKEYIQSCDFILVTWSGEN